MRLPSRWRCSAPPGLIGIHTNMPATVPPDIDKAAFAGAPAPSGLSADEKHAYDQLAFFYKHGLGYASEMANRPQTLYALADSPVGLAAWMLDHDAVSHGADVHGSSMVRPEGLTRDDMLDNITLLLVYEYGGFVGSSLLGKQACLLCAERRRRPGRRERLSRRALSGPARAGQRKPIPNSSITTGSTKADTLRPGSSRSYSRKSCALHSSHSANSMDQASRKTVIVTGASQGIGAGIAQAFLARGYDVVATARSATKSKELSASDHLALGRRRHRSI